MRKTRPIKGKWLKLTEGNNALDYLEKAYQFIQETNKDDLSWKWVILSLHSALYGFAICACKGTNYNNVTLNVKKGEKLISFNQALKNCQDPNRMGMYIHSKHLILTKNQKESIGLLKNTLRNNFEHYIPRLRLIEMHGLPAMCIDVLNVIRFLALDTNNYTHFSNAEIRQIKSLIYQSKKILKNSTLFKELSIASEIV